MKYDDFIRLKYETGVVSFAGLLRSSCVKSCL